jgi:hypothetical protein
MRSGPSDPAILDYLAPYWVEHAPDRPLAPAGPTGTAERATASAPAGHRAPQSIHACSDLVWWRWRAADGRGTATDGIDVVRLDEGRIAEHWSFADDRPGLLSPDDEPPSPDWSGTPDILRRSRRATGALYVGVDRYDATTRMAHVVASDGLDTPWATRAVAAVKALAPWFDLANQRYPANVNPLYDRLFRLGQAADAPSPAWTENVFPPWLRAVIHQIDRSRWARAVPIVVDGQVQGVIQFYFVEQLTDAQRETCDAFAQLIALSVDNARLSARLAQVMDGQGVPAPGRPAAAPAPAAMTLETPPELTYADLRVDTRRRVAARNDQPLGLTEREYRLIAYFVAHAEQALSFEQIAAAVWDAGPTDAAGLVESTVLRLRRKLDAAGPRLIHSARGYGYILQRE